MARFNPGILGEVRGKIGDYVVRKMNGKYFVSLRPEHYKISQNKKARDSRNGFGICVNLARMVNNSPELKLVWKSAPVEGTSAYHRILKHNLPLCREGNLTINNIITPSGLSNPVKNVSFDRESLIIQIDQEIVKGEFESEQFKIFYLIYMDQHIRNKDTTNQFVILSSELNVRNSLELNKNFSDVYQSLFGKFTKFIIYTSVLYDKGLKSFHSSTKGFEF